MVQQQEVGDNVWEISGMTLNFTGKILLFKNLSISSTEIFSGFKQVPSDLTFAQALELLKKEEIHCSRGQFCCRQTRRQVTTSLQRRACPVSRRGRRRGEPRLYGKVQWLFISRRETFLRAR